MIDAGTWLLIVGLYVGTIMLAAVAAYSFGKEMGRKENEDQD